MPCTRKMVMVPISNVDLRLYNIHAVSKQIIGINVLFFFHSNPLNIKVSTQFYNLSHCNYRSFVPLLVLIKVQRLYLLRKGKGQYFCEP